MPHCFACKEDLNGAYVLQDDGRALCNVCDNAEKGFKRLVMCDECHTAVEARLVVKAAGRCLCAACCAKQQPVVIRTPIMGGLFGYAERTEYPAGYVAPPPPKANDTTLPRELGNLYRQIVKPGPAKAGTAKPFPWKAVLIPAGVIGMLLVALNPANGGRSDSAVLGRGLDVVCGFIAWAFLLAVGALFIRAVSK